MNLTKAHHISLLDVFWFPFSANHDAGEGAKGKQKALTIPLIFKRLDQEDWGKSEMPLVPFSFKHSQCYGFTSNSLQFSVQEPKNPWRELLAVC